MANQPRNGHTGGPNPPDYVCPKRRGRRPFTIYLLPEVKTALLETARRNGTTMQDVGEQLCRAYIETAGRLLESSRRPAAMNLASGRRPRKSDGEVADAPC